MLRNTSVPEMMERVETAVGRASRARRLSRPIFVRADDNDLGLAGLRHPAHIDTEFFSGSSRPVVGPLIRNAKRAVRRGLRWYVKPMMEQQSRFNNRIIDVLERLARQDERLATRLERTEDRHETALDRMRADLLALAQAGSNGSGPASPAVVPPSTRLALQYRAFEDRHRGPYDEIGKLLKVYLPHFAGRRRVLDLGCGRGEFLNVLREAGISGYGVDIDESMVEAARAQGHEVVLGDAMAHLGELPSGTIDGVFSSQVAEHLQTSELMAMIDLAFRKLAPGGVIVIETPNPETLFIFAAFFYVDLTHVKPIHPEAMKWALEATGFVDARIERVLPVPQGARLDPVPEALRSAEGWAEVAANVDRLNNLLYGPQHYAAVATKPQEEGE